MIIGSNIYKRGSILTLNRKHEIDTVVSNPLSPIASLELLHTEVITTGNLASDNTSVVLPITSKARTASSLLRARSISQRAYWGEDFEAARGVAGYFMMKKSVTINVSEPVSNPQVSLAFEGYTRVVPNGEITYDNYPAHLANSEAIATFVDDNYTEQKTWTSMSDFVDYTQSKVLIHPFVKNLKKANGVDPNSANFSDAADRICLWTGGYPNDFYHGNNWKSARYPGWQLTVTGDNNNLGASPYSDPMWPEYFFTGGITSTTYADQRMRVAHHHASISHSITKVNDYQYIVHLEIPVKVVSYSSTRYSEQRLLTDEMIDLENIAFTDYVSKVTLSFQGVKTSGGSNEESYSLDAEGNLTNNLINVGIIRFPENRFIKENTILKPGVSWVTGMASTILEKYKSGKHTAELVVPGSWAIENNIKNNTEVKIRDLRGNILTKFFDTITFFNFVPGSYTTPTVGLEFVIGKDSIPPTDSGGIYMAYGANDIQLLFREGAPNGPISRVELINSINTSASYGGSIEFFDSSNNNVYSIFPDVYNQHDTYVTFKLLNNPYATSKLNQLMQSVSGINAESTLYYATAQLIFLIKGIQKMYDKRGFTYRLRMIEDSVDEISGSTVRLIPETINSISKAVEYYFERDLSLDVPISRIESAGGNYLQFSIRDANTLEVTRNVMIGRIVMNQSAQTLTIYMWTGGTSYANYMNISFADYNNGDNLWTFKFNAGATINSYLPSGILSNLGGYIA